MNQYKPIFLGTVDPKSKVGSSISNQPFSATKPSISNQPSIFNQGFGGWRPVLHWKKKRNPHVTYKLAPHPAIVYQQMAKMKRAANSQKCIRAGGKHNDLVSLFGVAIKKFTCVPCDSRTTSARMCTTTHSSRCLEIGLSVTTSKRKLSHGLGSRDDGLTF
jgi:hypothetical protein